VRLDGLPLALELAAARLRAMAVEQLAARLDDVFRLLGEGSRTAPSRQQTLRAALDWSHALLSEPEQALFRQLAVFAGGFEVEAHGVLRSTRRQPGQPPSGARVEPRGIRASRDRPAARWRALPILGRARASRRGTYLAGRAAQSARGVRADPRTRQGALRRGL